MDTAKTTPKDFFLWAGAMVSLYWSVVAFIFLMFDYINYAMPNPLSYYPNDPYQSGIPYEMASIIVLFPIYLVLAWIIRRDITQDATRAEIWVRRWVIILTLFIAGVTVAVDLIILLTTFLRGDEITLAFVLKVLVVLLVAVGACMHFIADLWGYWGKYPARRNAVFVGVLVLAFGTIAAGFFIVGTPGAARLSRFDDQKVSDLQNIQYQIVAYYQLKQKLPASLTDLNDSISGPTIPTDAQTKQSYEYHINNPLSFQLCATFNKKTSVTSGSTGYLTPAVEYGMKGADNWQHETGHNCFYRTIDPERYPQTAPTSKGFI